jgi:hypothetical protein
MSTCSFSIPFSESAESLVAKATTAIIRAGGQFNGNIHEGNFALQTFIGEIAGTYTTTEDRLKIENNEETNARTLQ